MAETLLKNNKLWAERVNRTDPDFFARLSEQQAPRYLWIGCSDSRVPANEIVGMDPGTIFVHRNVANLVFSSDLNVLSVIEYAVAVLKVQQIIVCGHYGCGGVKAAMGPPQGTLSDNWLRPIKDLYLANFADLEALEDDHARFDRLCELNVRLQVHNVASTAIVHNAWRSGAELAIHGFIYGIADGLLRDLACSIESPDGIEAIFRMGDG